MILQLQGWRSCTCRFQSNQRKPKAPFPHTKSLHIKSLNSKIPHVTSAAFNEVLVPRPDVFSFLHRCSHGCCPPRSFPHGHFASRDSNTRRSLTTPLCRAEIIIQCSCLASYKKGKRLKGRSHSPAEMMVSLFCFSSLFILGGPAIFARAALTARLDNSTVSGVSYGTVNKFLGIPYALPP